MDDIYNTNFQSNDGFCKILIRYNNINSILLNFLWMIYIIQTFNPTMNFVKFLFVIIILITFTKKNK
jgi:hypothetical protein